MWTEELYDRAYETVKDRKWPIVIPSYNRPDFITQKLFKFTEEENWPVYVVIRESQRDLYSVKYPYVTYITVPDRIIRNIGNTRAFIVRWAKAVGFDYIFMLDDDIKSFKYSISGTTKKGLPKAKVVDTSFSRYMAMWQVSSEALPDFILNGPILEQFAWTADCIDPDKCVDATSLVINAVCVNLKKMQDLGLNYGDNTIVGHEDIEMAIQAFEHGLPCVKFKFLTYRVNPSDLWGYSSMAERFQRQYDIMYHNHQGKSYVCFRKDMAGFPCVTLKYKTKKFIKSFPDSLYFWK